MLNSYFVVSRNRAAWKAHEGIDQAAAQLKELAGSVEFQQRIAGFDAAGRSAVVDAPVAWRVEEVERGSNRLLRDCLTICPRCRSVVVAEQSCGCFDNGCQ